MELLDSELANILSGHSNPSHGFMLKNMVPGIPVRCFPIDQKKGIPVRQSFKIFKIFKQIIRFNLTKKNANYSMTCYTFNRALMVSKRYTY